jgi:hypothetical protein
MISGFRSMKFNSSVIIVKLIHQANQRLERWYVKLVIAIDNYNGSEYCNGYPWFFFQRFQRSIYEDFHYNFL